MSLRHAETLNNRRNLFEGVRKFFVLCIHKKHECIKPLTLQERELEKLQYLKKQLEDTIEAREFLYNDMQPYKDSPDTAIYELLQRDILSQDRAIEELEKEIDMVKGTLKKLENKNN